MFLFALLLGLSLGIGFHLWQRHQIDRQLKRIVQLLGDDALGQTSLPLISSIRSEITRIKEQRQELVGELEVWQNLMDVAPIGYLIVDEENQLLWCNQQAQNLLKIDRWQPGQLRLLLELVRSYELDRLLEETRNSQKPQVQEWTFYPTNSPQLSSNIGRSFVPRQESLALKASSFPLAKGKVVVFLENQQPLVELSRSRERAFSDLTHELRTPLTSIFLVTEALQKRIQEPERRWVDQMLKEINRLISLVRDWLEIGQLENNASQYLRYESIELKDLIFSVWQNLNPLAKQKELELVYRGPERIDISADKPRLTQVFLNIFDNAIKYSPDRGEIQVEIERDLASNPNLIINIIDSGSGFNPSDLPHVFERLYRGDISRARQSFNSDLSESLSETKGNGLGLSIVWQIVRAHGGMVTAQNHPSTGGAWLRITLPIEGLG
jgi:two-component system phosphate regulon sensor histidine kinase PhoR